MKILIVEDDKTISTGLEYYLTSEGYEVTVCESKKEAEKRLWEGFDLYLLDLTLPDGSGYDICRLVKKNMEVPVIFLTACDEEVNVVMGLDMGADDYITKPFRVRELLSRMKATLRHYNKNESNHDIVTIDHITIHTKAAKVYKNGVEVLLTSMEYRLLLIFVNNKNQILTRNQLLQEIWDVDGNFINDNTLSVYIKRLREKLEEDNQNPKIITTVRGLGYRLEERNVKE